MTRWKRDILQGFIFSNHLKGEAPFFFLPGYDFDLFLSFFAECSAPGHRRDMFFWGSMIPYINGIIIIIKLTPLQVRMCILKIFKRDILQPKMPPELVKSPG